MNREECWSWFIWIWIDRLCSKEKEWATALQLRIDKMYTQAIDDLLKTDALDANGTMNTIRKKMAAKKYGKIRDFCQDLWQMGAEKEVLNVVESVISITMPWLAPSDKSESDPHHSQQQISPTVGIKVRNYLLADAVVVLLLNHWLIGHW